MANLSKYYGAQPLIADVTFTAFGITYANEYSNMIMNAASISKSIYINLLKGIAGNPTYYLNDNIHFNELAHPIMMENVWDALIPALN